MTRRTTSSSSAPRPTSSPRATPARLKPDGTYDKAYLAGLSITTIAALDRLIELEKLAGRVAEADELSRRRDLVRSGLPLLQTPEGYFIKSLDPDGTKHGVFGAARYGYFEASPNHDAIAFRVVPDDQAREDLRQDRRHPAAPPLRPHPAQLSRRSTTCTRSPRASGSSATGSTAGTGRPARRG